ncbi:MAG: hypothetical protein K9J16_08770 [Melioribacteraceae bacterium]|nr:hypothetical protein [Melioribacteraceae bacterium]MCF8353988.1 hypothetical protein [Melioribacteraceae bacterium]MCF8393716.1 hypothetical protein [Melioribacteraceae bacterium]MCF8419542.1 hypothetical protein [Melioribacteraceae bacterium]
MKFNNILIVLILLCIPILSQNKEFQIPLILDEILIEELGEISDSGSSIIIYDFQNDSYSYFNRDVCKQRFDPKSTFKIPNSIIALETGVLEDENSIIKWDSLKNPREDLWKELKLDWARDHSLYSAFQNSVVWYYQEAARRIGGKTMQEYLDKFDYGNKNISDGIDQFWLTGSLKISAVEQVQFLKKFLLKELEISDNTYEVVRKIMKQYETNEYTISYKTGGGYLAGNRAIGWIVGLVERTDNKYMFAFNTRNKDLLEIFKTRTAMLKSALTKLDIIKN